MTEVGFERSANSVRTVGLRQSGQQEIQIDVSSADLLPYARGFLKFVSNHLKQSERRILAGETLAYGYWLVKFIESQKDHLDVWGYDESATTFVPGGSLALAYWRDQHSICDQFAAEFTPPVADKLAMIHDGILEGGRVDAVRYPSPEHMSGWWITSDRYTGPADLRNIHLYHVTAARPDIAPYLALPYGFRFNFWGPNPEVRFDPAVASESASPAETL